MLIVLRPVCRQSYDYPMFCEEIHAESSWQEEVRRTRCLSFGEYSVLGTVDVDGGTSLCASGRGYAPATGDWMSKLGHLLHSIYEMQQPQK